MPRSASVSDSMSGSRNGSSAGRKEPSPTATSAGRSGRPSRVPDKRDGGPHRAHGEADLARGARARLEGEVEPAAVPSQGLSLLGAEAGRLDALEPPARLQLEVEARGAGDLDHVAEGVRRHAGLGLRLQEPDALGVPGGDVRLLPRVLPQVEEELVVVAG